MTKWVYRKGELAKGQFDVVIDQSVSGMKHAFARIAKLGSIDLASDEFERVVFILEGQEATVAYVNASGSGEFNLKGRTSVFSGMVDHLYLPRHTSAVITGNARVFIAEAKAKGDSALQLVASEDVPRFTRGAGSASREIHDFGGPGIMNATNLVCVEVLVPSGNWSGIPPHKHDEFRPGVESNLEEIYYFETRAAGGVEPHQPAKHNGYFRGYSSDERAYEVDTLVSSGDVALVPFGYHGPSAAIPNADLYFTNVMAGPDPVRDWLAVDDPDHVWIREAWKTMPQDPRLPFKFN